MGEVTGVTEDKRIPIKAWAVISGGELTSVWIDELIARRNADLDYAMGINAWVEPVTLIYGHESEAIRDAW